VCRLLDLQVHIKSWSGKEHTKQTFYNYTPGIFILDWVRADAFTTNSPLTARVCSTDGNDRVKWNIPAQIPVVTLDRAQVEVISAAIGVKMTFHKHARPSIPAQTRRLASMCEAALDNVSMQDAAEVASLSKCAACDVRSQSHPLRTCSFCLCTWHTSCEVAVSQHVQELTAEGRQALHRSSEVLPSCMRSPEVFLCRLCTGRGFCACIANVCCWPSVEAMLSCFAVFS
jgi:hypothetical protein